MSGRQRTRSQRNRMSGMMKRLCAPIMVLWLGVLVGSCSSFSAYVADHWPRWAGGEPDDVPPRPGAPGYDDFAAHGRANKDATGSTAAAATDKASEQAAKTNPQPVSANVPEPQPATATRRDALGGGLY